MGLMVQRNGTTVAMAKKGSAELFFLIITQILEGLFLVVSKPIFATKGSFCTIMFRDVQDRHSSAPLQIQNCSFSALIFRMVLQNGVFYVLNMFSPFLVFGVYLY